MKTVLLIGVVLVCASGAVAYWSIGKSPVAVSSDQSAVSVGGSATLGEVIVIRALGYVEPVSEIRKLGFKVEGVIDTCPVEVGQQVKKHDLLMSLRSQDEAAAIAVAQQELALANAERDLLLAGTPPHQITAAEHQVGLLNEHVRHAQKHFERRSALFLKTATTLEDLDQAETDLLRARKSLQQAEAELMHLKHVVRSEDKLVAQAKICRAEARLQSAKASFDNTLLKAPSNGTVLEILRREGEGSGLVGRDPVMVFADDSRLRVRAEVDERFTVLLKTGQPVVVYGRGLGQHKYAARIVLIKKIMGPKTVFSRDAAERKDLDIIQVLIETPKDFQAPIGLQVDVDITTE